MGYKTKSMIYALTFGSKEKEQTGMKTPFDVRLPGGLTQKFEGKPFVKSEKEKKEPGAYSQGAKLLDETSQNDVVLSGLTSQDWGTRLGTSLGIMVNKIRKNKKQKNLSEGKGKGKGSEGKGGKGWGYQGTCFNCGKVGHKAAECVSTWAPQVAEVGEEVIGSVEVGGVWVVACVEKVVAK